MAIVLTVTAPDPKDQTREEIRELLEASAQYLLGPDARVELSDANVELVDDPTKPA
jgi:hypothetical protein